MIKSIVLQNLEHDGILYRPSPNPNEPTLVVLTEIQRIHLRSLGVIGDDVEVPDGDDVVDIPERKPRRRQPEPPDAA